MQANNSRNVDFSTLEKQYNSFLHSTTFQSSWMTAKILIHMSKIYFITNFLIYGTEYQERWKSPSNSNLEFSKCGDDPHELRTYSH